MTTLCYTTNPPDDSGRLLVPDVRVTAYNHEHNYLACRGYSASLAVLDIDDRCIGWIDTQILGFENVKAWMAFSKSTGKARR